MSECRVSRRLPVLSVPFLNAIAPLGKAKNWWFFSIYCAIISYGAYCPHCSFAARTHHYIKDQLRIGSRCGQPRHHQRRHHRLALTTNNRYSAQSLASCFTVCLVCALCRISRPMSLNLPPRRHFRPLCLHFASLTLRWPICPAFRGGVWSLCAFGTSLRRPHANIISCIIDIFAPYIYT